jgi:hypothetical protein
MKLLSKEAIDLDGSPTLSWQLRQCARLLEAPRLTKSARESIRQGLLHVAAELDEQRLQAERR